MTIHYQNRYERPCTLEVLLQHKGLPDVKALIPCGPAGFGKWSADWPVSADFTGCRVALEIRADVHYPEGRGRALRFKEGIRVGGLDDHGRALALLAGILAGKLWLISPASVEVMFPPDLVPGKGTETGAGEVEEIWTLTNAFASRGAFAR